MKKIFYKIGSILIMVTLMANSVKAQLPMKYGDVAVTYRYGQSNANTNAVLNSVLAVLRSSNTSQATPGQVWTLPGYGSGSQNKPAWYSDSRWTQANLGDVFGITIDNFGNIYVSSTRIYTGTDSPKIFEIDATTGNITTLTFSAFAGSFGNLKFVNIGGNGYLYVSDWGNGKIHRLVNANNNNSNHLTNWVYADSFNPEFGRPLASPSIDNDNAHGQIPYGLAIRNMPNGGKALYYSRIGKSVCSTMNCAVPGWGYDMAGTTSTFSNEVWSVKLNNTGDFDLSGPPNGEQIQTLPTFLYDNPIADIAFTSDGKRMLLAQQSLCKLTCLGAHYAEVHEVIESPGNNWSPSGNTFPTGNSIGIHHQANAVGGISYSNNVLYGDDTKFSCDTTVWAVSDVLFYSGSGQLIPPLLPYPKYSLVYGAQAYTSKGIHPYITPTFTNYQNSLLVDEDDYYDDMNKYLLGDIEVYNKPLDCAPTCACGQWQSGPTLNGTAIPAVPIIMHPLGTEATQNKSMGMIPINGGPSHPIQFLVDYPIQFVQGNVSGVINDTYQCTGTCGATYSWGITNDANSAIISSGTTLPIDLAHYNSLMQCGTYTLSVKSQCGNSKCGGLTIPITIICEPPGCCKATIDIDSKGYSVNTVTNIPDPNAYSTANLTYNLNYSLPMSEVRVSVEEFRLVANSTNCLNCNNRPVTWGNILAASLNGAPMTLSGMTSVPTGSLPADYREAVYNTGTPLAPSSAGVNIKLSLPAVTELSCCEVSAYICLKFTFKDTDCRECVKMVCGEIKLVPPTTINNGNNKLELKKFDVKH